MVLRLLRGRARDEQAKHQLARMFYQIEASAPHPGWLDGWIGFADADPLAFVVVERWGSRSAVDGWSQSQDWRDRLAQAQPLLAGPIRESLYLA